jgi:hypothetical protein
MLVRLRSILVRFLTSLGPHPNWFLGSPQRATLAAVVPTGYVLLIQYTNGTDWATLPSGPTHDEWSSLSTQVTDDRPTEGQLAEVDAALAARRLVRTEPWAIDLESRLCASIAVARDASGGSH